MQTLSPTKPTIIIAAFNEASCIRGTLSSLGSGTSKAFQVLVVCNGCTDNTEEIISSEFPLIFKENRESASKSLAIRHAESLDIGYPRLYLDADITLSENDAEKLINTAQEHTEAALFVPHSHIDTQASDQLVKTYYQAWYSTPHVKLLGFGSGAYLLNQSGREKFGLWPELIADDGFLRTLFKINEICIIDNTLVTVKAPKTIWALLKIKTRSKFGNLELKKQYKINRIELPNNSRLQMSLLQRLVYSAINVVALVWAHSNQLTGNAKWHRDNSNR